MFDILIMDLPSAQRRRLKQPAAAQRRSLPVRQSRFVGLPVAAGENILALSLTAFAAS